MREETSRLPAVLLNPALGAVLLLAGLVAVVGSAYLSHVSGNGEWFQRSGSVFVLFSVLVEIQQSSIKQPKEAGWATIDGRPTLVGEPISAVSKWLHRFAWAGIVVGTVIWGYGDLVF